MKCIFGKLATLPRTYLRETKVSRPEKFDFTASEPTNAATSLVQPLGKGVATNFNRKINLRQILDLRVKTETATRLPQWESGGTFGPCGSPGECSGPPL
jgi:hypothetical protein